MTSRPEIDWKASANAASRFAQTKPHATDCNCPDTKTSATATWSTSPRRPGATSKRAQEQRHQRKQKTATWQQREERHRPADECTNKTPKATAMKSGHRVAATKTRARTNSKGRCGTDARINH